MNNGSLMLFGMTFGKRLRAAREAKKMTQTDLGRGLGTDGADVSKQAVQGWEAYARFPRVDQLAIICKRLGVSADHLVFGEGMPGLVSEKVREAVQVVDGLDDEERLQLLARILGPAATNEEVEARMPNSAKRPKSAPARHK